MVRDGRDDDERRRLTLRPIAGAERFARRAIFIRFNIVGGTPSFRVGVRRDERADITVEVSAGTARALNLLLSDDPRYKPARDAVIETGEMRVDGDPLRLGGWLDAVHDPIVDRTKIDGVKN